MLLANLTPQIKKTKYVLYYPGVITSFLDVKQTVLSKSHYLLYGLAAAVQPRMLVTFDSELRPLPVSVRVGQAVDVVGQAGKPKTITGFQVGVVWVPEMAIFAN